MVCADCLAEVEPQQESCDSCGFVRPTDGWTPDPLTGLILGGRYRLEGRLGAGGMASVFRASRIGALGGHVAVKVLAPRFARTVIARRFEREAQVVARLTNPYIVRIYDFDTFTFTTNTKGAQTSVYYIAMELIEGQTLSQLLRGQGKVNFLWGIDVLRQLARGLEEAHAQGIVHRDLKPSNIVLMRQRGSTHVKILDFGIAALSAVEQEAGGQEKLTQVGLVSGTPDYMAPEQAVGDSVGPAADMFSIGVIAFEMFSGRKPFEGPTMESLLARVTKAAPSLSEVVSDASFPPELYRIVDKLLQRDQKLRYQHAGELLDDLGRFPTLQTTPDFVMPAELLERYATSASQAAMQVPAEQREATLTNEGAPGKAKAKGAAPHRTMTSEVMRQEKSTAWVWILALLILGGAATAVVLAVTQGSSPVTPEPPAVVAPFLEGERPALEAGFSEQSFPFGGARVTIASPPELGPLYRPVPLRIAFERGGRPMRITAAHATMSFSRDGKKIGETHGAGRADGRLAIDLPPRPFLNTFEVLLALTLGGGEQYDARFMYDARNGTFRAP